MEIAKNTCSETYLGEGKHEYTNLEEGQCTNVDDNKLLTTSCDRISVSRGPRHLEELWKHLSLK